MAPAVLLAMLLVALPLGYLVWSLLSVDRRSQRAMREMLALGTDPAELTQRERSGLLERAGYRLTPAAYVRKLDRLLSLAGRPASLPLGRVLAAKPLLGLLGALLGLLHQRQRSPMPILKLVGFLVFLLGYFIPDLLLYSKGQERQKVMQLELANTLDQMLISVEAGPGLRRSHGPRG